MNRTLHPETLSPRLARSWRVKVGIAAVVVAVAVVALLTSAERRRIARHRAALDLVSALGHEAWPRWRAAHPGDACPRDAADLVPYARVRAARDPWGNDVRFMCTKDPGEEFIVSSGPDGTFGTRDDITSVPRARADR